MQEQLTDYQQELRERISTLVDKLFRKNSLYMVKADVLIAALPRVRYHLFSHFEDEN